MAAETLHIISSCTKTITALLAGIAIDQGLFSLDDKIADHFPGVVTTWVGGDGKPPVLVRHVLSMTAGTGHTVKYAQDLLESTDVERLVLGWDLVAPPGARYNYDNGLPSSIGCLIERTSGLTLVDIANQQLFGPMGITRVTWTDMPTPTERPYVSDPPVLSAGGMGLALPDFLKLGQMLLQNGQYDGRQIIPEAYLAEATRQQTKTEDYPYGYYFHIWNMGRKTLPSRIGLTMCHSVIFPAPSRSQSKSDDGSGGPSGQASSGLLAVVDANVRMDRLPAPDQMGSLRSSVMGRLNQSLNSDVHRETCRVSLTVGPSVHFVSSESC